MGEALGKLYVADYFPQKPRPRSGDDYNLKAALADRIRSSTGWMSRQTGSAKKLAP